MPVTKSLLCRLQIINTCLNSKIKRYWSLQDLLDKLADNDIAISRRTLESDIEALRFDERLGYLAPISYCAINRGYHYTDEGYSINRLKLTEEEIETLLIANELIRPYDNLGCVKNFPSVIRKIVTSASVCMLKGAEMPEVLIGSALPLEQSENVNLLLQAIREKVVVKIVYQATAGKEREKFFFHPYQLHEFEHRWYVAGINEFDMSQEFVDLQFVERVLISSRYFDSKFRIQDSGFQTSHVKS